ncbi:MAG: Dyp-type peroxidase [SAR324 cluster bacterium]|nr:Dyp-type peroxidase [SAR324 cluster bacterium]
MTPQTGIIPEAGKHGLFVVLNVQTPQAQAQQVFRICSKFPELLTAISQMDTSANLCGTISFGATFWNLISPQKRPLQLKTFQTISGSQQQIPATGGDILFHVHSSRPDLNYELLQPLLEQLGSQVSVVEDVQAKQYLDSRDLTGFIDGTENPEGDERAEAALIGEEDPEFAGGSYVFSQRFVHKMTSWNKLSQGEQENIIGRTKPDSVELAEDVKPPTSHISRVVIEEEGDELQIVRHSLPYYSLSGEKGLFFLAYTKDLTIVDKMLSNMFGTSGDGLTDHLMNYTTPVTGAMFFTPSLETLRNVQNLK